MASNNNNNNLMNVREFFKNKSIFLTGATGFLGKVGKKFTIFFF
jgi:hypothetical protein